jgi:hypothetical protein
METQRPEKEEEEATFDKLVEDSQLLIGIEHLKPNF